MARRIRIYLFGVILGSVLVYATLLKDRSKELLKWTPNQRMLEEFRAADLQFNSLAVCQMNCLEVGKQIFAEIFDDGKVNFGKSKPKEIPAMYYVSYESNNKTYVVNLLYDKKTVVIKDFSIIQIDNCLCDE
jgi:hypothetical protein